MSRLGIVAMLAVLLTGCSGVAGADRIVVAAGTTIVDSGFIEAVVAEYERSFGGSPVSVVAAATGQALTLADGGGVDVTITHNSEAENAFVADHPGTSAIGVFSSSFVLVGPPSPASELAGVDVVTAFRQIAERGWVFVARADGSGTSVRENTLWETAGGRPAPSRYLETGLGMGETLQIAGNRQAFTLSEAGAFASADVAGLVVVDLADATDMLGNQYRAIAVSPKAEEFVAWLQSAEGAAAVRAADSRLFDPSVYRTP